MFRDLFELSGKAEAQLRKVAGYLARGIENSYSGKNVTLNGSLPDKIFENVIKPLWNEGKNSVSYSLPVKNEGHDTQLYVTGTATGVGSQRTYDVIVRKPRESNDELPATKVTFQVNTEGDVYMSANSSRQIEG